MSFLRQCMNVLYYLVIILGFGLSSLLFFNKENPSYLKTFSPFLAFSLIIEYSSTFLANKGIHTIPLYNISGIIEFCFYLWVFYNVIKRKIVKQIIAFLFVGFPLISVLNILFLQGIGNFNSITYSLGCLMIILFSILYFFELFNVQASYRFSNDPAFWISTALLFFYSVTFPVYVSTNLMKHFSNRLGEFVFLIAGIMNIVMYSLFCVAFICQIKLNRNKENNNLIIK